MFKIHFHFFILQILISTWPNLFKRYYEEYKRAARLLRRRRK